VQIATDNSTKAQQWTITDRGQGIYNLINASSGKALAVSQAATTDGANVQIYTNNGTDAQGWYITDVNGNIYLGNIGSGSALNVSNNGINTNIWSYNGKEEQQWHLTKT
jgi:mannan endo-1,4-beta-mannosidase